MDHPPVFQSGCVPRNSGVSALKDLGKYLLFFVGGITLGAFLWSDQRRSTQTPIKVPFCFVMHNGSLFYGRQILTTGHLMTDVHGEYLADPECDDKVMTFDSSPSEINTEGEHALDIALTADMAAHRYADVTFTFVGTMRSNSRLRAMLDWTKDRVFKIPTKRPIDLELDQVMSVDTAKVRNE